MNSTSFKKKKINHVAIIMDGNGRWAKRKNISKKQGHRAGVENCIKICKNIKKLDFDVNEISFFIFSTENWKRAPNEIKNLFNLIELYYSKFKVVANSNNLRVRHYGSRSKLSKKILNIIDNVSEITGKNSGTFINLMFNYGSRQEISDAIKKIKQSQTRNINIQKYLYISKSKDPDLIIRTGGEKRLSNFMLWQCAYSELYFTKILWPDFNYIKLNKAIIDYFTRKRNYGK